MNIAANFSLTDNEIAEIKASDQTTLIDAGRWGTDANPEGQLIFLCDGTVVTVVSAEQTIARGEV